MIYRDRFLFIGQEAGVPGSALRGDEAPPLPTKEGQEEICMADYENRTGPAHLRKGGNKAKGVIIAVCVLVVAAVAGVCIFLAQQARAESAREAEIAAVLDTDAFYEGISVEGVSLGGMTMEEAREALKEKEASLRETFSITLTYEDQSFTVTQDDVDFLFDTEAVLEEAYQYGRTGSREERYQQVTALRESPRDFTLSHTMEYTGLKDKLAELTAPLNADPVDASVTAFNSSTEEFDIAEGQPGRQVDVDALYTQVEAILNSTRTGTVEIPVTETPYEVTAEDLRQNLKKLGEYSTTSTNTANGNYNMARAMASINGTCVQPGETFSYFGVVGPAGRNEGYKAANAIVNGKLIPSYGGGICQTSTTLYGAVLRSGLEIVERSNHSIPSTYCPIGQDAAVSYPNMDFKFRNNTDYPIYIIAGMEGKTVYATIYGWQSPEYDTIEITSWYTETIPALTTPTYSLDNSLAEGQVRLDQKAYNGYRAAAARTYYKDGVEVKSEALPNSYYRPSGPYYSYGPGTDISSNPGATSGGSSSSQASSAPASSAPASSAPASSAPAASSQAPASSAPPASSQEGQPDPEGGASSQAPQDAASAAGIQPDPEGETSLAAE